MGGFGRRVGGFGRRNGGVRETKWGGSGDDKSLNYLFYRKKVRSRLLDY